MNGDILLGSGLSPWQNGRAFSVTFVVTEDCNLCCKYCYQVHKNSKSRMTIETAKNAVDFILENPDIFIAESVIWDFIGGEPLLEIKLIDEICDYIKFKTFKLKHKWRSMYRFSFSSNGILYKRPEVKEFIYKNKEKCSFCITIDGTKEKHDLQRVYHDGHGSYDDVIKSIPAWLEDFPLATTKVTFGSEDLPLLKESIIHLWNLGIKMVPANVVFEDIWHEGDDVIFEAQLKELADYIIDNRIWDYFDCSLFDKTIGIPLSDEQKNRNFCGSGKMIAIDAEGYIYPCLRFMDFSLNNKKPKIIGDIYNGLYLDKIRPFLGLTTLTQSDDECITCDIASGCAWCQGNNYDSSDNNTIYERAKFACKMHKARVRANNYLWRRLETVTDKKYKPSGRKFLYFILSDDSIEYCQYDSTKNTVMKEVMNSGILQDAMQFCDQSFFEPVLLHSTNQKNIDDVEYELSFPCRQILSVNNHTNIKGNVYYVVDKENFNKLNRCDICILNIKRDDIKNLSIYVNKLLETCKRININFLDLNNSFHFEEYTKQLEIISKNILMYYVKGRQVEVNVISDRMYLNSMNNCDAGIYNFAVAPNGRIYICPAFYYDEPDNYVGDIYAGIDYNKVKQCKLGCSPICMHCDSYHCNRCTYINKKFTEEINTPPGFECRKSHVERTASKVLEAELKKMNLIDDRAVHIDSINYTDPIFNVVNMLGINPYGRIFEGEGYEAN